MNKIIVTMLEKMAAPKKIRAIEFSASEYEIAITNKGIVPANSPLNFLNFIEVAQIL